MALHQYIGARYVPRFLGVYDATTIYEALDVVDNGLGTSYISRKTVPAGVPLTNTEYWAIYGASSGAIINLQNQIDDINAEVKLLQKGVWTQSEMSEKTVIMIGDSWGTTGAGMTNNWIDRLSPYFGTVYSNAHGGYSFNRSGASYITLFDALTIPSGTEIDAVIAIGGANPTGAGEVTAFVNHVKSVYPNARIIIGANGPQYSRSTFFKRMKVIEKEAALAECIVLEDLWYITATSTFSNWTADHYHLIEYTEYAENIVAFLTSGTYAHEYNRHEFFEVKWENVPMAEYFKDVAYTLWNRYNKHIQMIFNINKGTHYTAASDSLTLTSGTEITLGYISHAMFLPFYDNSNSGIANKGYRIYRNDYYDLYLTMPNDQPFVAVVFVARQSGTFAKSTVFNDTSVLYTNMQCDMFDFKEPVRDQDIVPMLSWTTDMLY